MEAPRETSSLGNAASEVLLAAFIKAGRPKKVVQANPFEAEAEAERRVRVVRGGRAKEGGEPVISRRIKVSDGGGRTASGGSTCETGERTRMPVRFDPRGQATAESSVTKERWELCPAVVTPELAVPAPPLPDEEVVAIAVLPLLLPLMTRDERGRGGGDSRDCCPDVDGTDEW